MSTLYLDLGNTKAKWLLSSGQSGAVSYSQLSQQIKNIRQHHQDLKQVVLASVLNERSTHSIVAELAVLGITHVRRCVVTSSAAGVLCGYEDVSRLGVDRWLAVVAVWCRYKSACLVADLGTAATLDLVDADGQHLGGFIVSGLSLAVSGLLHGTQNIRPDREGFDDASLVPGNNTASAVYNGALSSLVALVETQFQKLLKRDSNAKLIIAGGDASIVGSRLQSNYELVQGLVFDGMMILEQAQLLVEGN